MIDPFFQVGIHQLGIEFRRPIQLFHPFGKHPLGHVGIPQHVVGQGVSIIIRENLL